MAATTPPPPPPPPLVVDRPSHRVLIREGNAGRLLLGGTWYFRQDDARSGEARGFQRMRSLGGWSAIGVPHNWNATDTTENKQSVGWYRKEFRLPRSPRGRRLRWVVRFESANAQAKVWLNGRPIGKHSGGYFPFELDLQGLHKGRNRLVVKVSNVRSPRDLTHWRIFGAGGWWNFGGLLREVYVRPVDTVDIGGVQALPRLRCVRCAARVGVRLNLRNLTGSRQRAQLTLTVRGPHAPGTVRLTRTASPRSTRAVATSFTIRRPRLWQPGRPTLYRLTVSAAVGGRRVSSYRLAFGVRKLEVRGSQVYLNGHALQLRGASVHEDDPRTGGVFTRGERGATLARLRQLGASVTRAQYPLHPAFMEALDRAGILFWQEAPIYQLTNRMLDSASIRRAALRAVQATVQLGANHPSIFVWSLGNELGQEPSAGGSVGAGYARFVREGAAAVKALDRTRLVGLDRNWLLGAPFDWPAMRRLDVFGVNEYFGWYGNSAPGVAPTQLSDLGPHLDRLHATYPNTPLFITEFGAEATRLGPETQRGTFEFQRRYVMDHLAVHASKPYVNGSIVWILKDFRVHPTWVGGNDPAYATPPWNNKGLIDESGAIKPAFWAMQGAFRATRPLR